jgi:hypothetical protein
MPVWICERKNYRKEYDQGEPEWIVVARVAAETKKEAAIKAFGYDYCTGQDRIRKAK